MIWKAIQGFFGKNVSRDDHLYSDLAMTPMGIHNLSVAMEMNFGIPRDKVNLKDCKTFGDVERAYKAVSRPKVKSQSLLFTNVSGVPHCALTGQKCYTALNAKRDGDEDVCLRADCKIAQNFYRLAQKVR